METITVTFAINPAMPSPIVFSNNDYNFDNDDYNMNNDEDSCNASTYPIPFTYRPRTSSSDTLPSYSSHEAVPPPSYANFVPPPYHPLERPDHARLPSRIVVPARTRRREQRVAIAVARGHTAQPARGFEWRAWSPVASGDAGREASRDGGIGNTDGDLEGDSALGDARDKVQAMAKHFWMWTGFIGLLIVVGLVILALVVWAKGQKDGE